MITVLRTSKRLTAGQGRLWNLPRQAKDDYPRSPRPGYLICEQLEWRRFPCLVINLVTDRKETYTRDPRYHSPDLQAAGIALYVMAWRWTGSTSKLLAILHCQPD